MAPHPKSVGTLTQKQLQGLLQEAARAVDSLVQNTKDMPVREIAWFINAKLASEGFLQKIVDARFQKQAGPEGPWKPLATATVKQREAQGFGGTSPILERSGTLRSAAVQGNLDFDAESISMEMLDRPAPVYLGGARFRPSRKRKGQKQRKLSDYAAGLNAVRNFYGPPTEEELEPMKARRNELMIPGSGS